MNVQFTLLFTIAVVIGAILALAAYETFHVDIEDLSNAEQLVFYMNERKNTHITPKILFVKAEAQDNEVIIHHNYLGPFDEMFDPQFRADVCAHKASAIRLFEHKDIALKHLYRSDEDVFMSRTFEVACD